MLKLFSFLYTFFIFDGYSVKKGGDYSGEENVGN